MKHELPKQEESLLNDASDRLEGLGDDRAAELLTFTVHHKSGEIKKFLEENHEKLEPEAKFFLEATLLKRSAESEGSKTDDNIKGLDGTRKSG